MVASDPLIEDRPRRGLENFLCFALFSLPHKSKTLNEFATVLRLHLTKKVVRITKKVVRTNVPLKVRHPFRPQRDF